MGKEKRLKIRNSTAEFLIWLFVSESDRHIKKALEGGQEQP
jgi:hypothetical protein